MGDLHHIRLIPCSQFAPDCCRVVSDGVVAEVELSGNLFGLHPECCQLEYLELPCGQLSLAFLEHCWRGQRRIRLLV